MKFRFQKIKGKANINWELINVYMSRWKDDTWFDGEIIRHQHKKSDPLRRYHFGAVLPKLMKHIGYEPDEKLFFHWQLKIKYFNIEPDKKGIYTKVPSVFSDKSDIPVSEKKEFVSWVKRKASKMGCYIEDPQSQ